MLKWANGERPHRLKKKYGSLLVYAIQVRKLPFRYQWASLISVEMDRTWGENINDNKSTPTKKKEHHVYTNTLNKPLLSLVDGWYLYISIYSLSISSNSTLQNEQLQQQKIWYISFLNAHRSSQSG